MLDSYHCHEVTKDGRKLGRSIELLHQRGVALDRVALDAIDCFLDKDDKDLDWTITTHVRVEPTDGRDPATFEVVGRWTRHFEAEAKLVPPPVPS